MSNQECVGRFQFAVPAGIILAGRSQSIYGVDVTTEPVPAAGLRSLWDERILKIRSRPLPPGVQDAVMRAFELLPGVPAVWYYRNSTVPELAALQAMRQFGDHALVINAGAELDAGVRQRILNGGSEEIVERLVSNVANQYSPGVGRGFCAGYGSILGKPSKYEITDARFDRHPATTGWQMTFHTETVSESNRPKGPDAAEARDTASQTGDSLEVIGESVRKAAGLEGHELVIKVSPAGGGEPLLRFTWFFEGVPGRADTPSIQMRLGAAASRMDLAKSEWETVISSLRPVPLQ